MTTVAERLRELQGSLGKAEFARLCGIKPSSLATYLDGSSLPSFENLVSIGRATGASLDWIATGQGRKSSEVGDTEIRIRKLAFRAAAGSGSLVIEEAGSTLTLAAELLTRLGIRPQNARALAAQGTSMDPTIKDGDTMILDVSLTDFIDGQVFAFTVADEAFVKRLYRGFRGRLVMSSDNPDFKDVPLPPEEPFRIIGQVKWAERVL